MSALTTPRINPVDLQSLLRLPPFGGESGGYLTEGDVLPRVTQTVDGLDLNSIWLEMQTALAEWNSHRSAIVDLLSYWHTSTAEAVSQGVNEQSFEEASEFGEPEGLRPPSEHVLLGFTFRDFDRAARFTWKALRDMDSRQVRAVHDGALNSDNRLVTGTILQRLFLPMPEENGQGNTCYGLWSADGMTPPPFLGRAFDGDHTHYRVTGSEDIDSGDLLEAVKNIREHGYGLIDSNQQLIALVNERESDVIQSFRANVENNNDQTSKWDFLPATNQPSFILQGAGELVGNLPPGEVFCRRLENGVRSGLSKRSMYRPVTSRLLPPAGRVQARTRSGSASIRTRFIAACVNSPEAMPRTRSLRASTLGRLVLAPATVVRRRYISSRPVAVTSFR